MQSWHSAMLGGIVGGLVVALATMALKTTASGADTKAESSIRNCENESSPATVIERQIVVREPVTLRSSEPRADAPEALPSAADPTNIAADMEAMFQNDRGPTDAARKSEATLRAAFTDRQLTGVHLDRLECRADTCRAEVTFENAQADRLAFTHLLGPESPVSQLGKASIVPIRNTTADGKVAATVYFYSPSQLPAPE